MRIFKSYCQLLNDNNNTSDRDVKFITQRIALLRPHVHTHTHKIVLFYEHLPFTLLVMPMLLFIINIHTSIHLKYRPL